MKEGKQVKSDSCSYIQKRAGRLEGVYTRLHMVQQHGTDMLQVNTLLMHRWELFAKIGVGAHSEVYAAYDRELGMDVAIKAEKSQARLLNEVQVLRALKTTQHFCHYIHYQPTYIVNFLVMSLQGPSLKEIKDHFKPLSWKTVMNIGFQMLEAIQALHMIGYVHGDIKPSCFLIGLPPDDMATIYLIDFGLSRKLKPNNTTSFRADNQLISNSSTFGKDGLVKAVFQGSYKYASPTNHMGFRLGRRDDLWSLLYTLLDLMCDLPWSHINKQDKILDMKNRYTDDLINTYIGNEGKTLKNLIKRMNLSDMPNYDQLKGCFTKALRHYPSGELHTYEWVGQPNVLWHIDYVRVYDDDKDEEETEEVIRGEELKEEIETPSGELLEVLEKQEIIPEIPEAEQEIRKSLLKSEERSSGERERRTLAFNPIVETSSEPSVFMQKERSSEDVKTSPVKIDEEKEEFSRVPLVVSRLIPISKKCRKHYEESMQSAASLRYFVQRPRYVTDRIFGDCDDND